MTLWADLDRDGRAALAEELAAKGVFAFSGPDLDDPTEPVWVNEAGDFVDIDGRVLPKVTVRPLKGPGVLVLVVFILLLVLFGAGEIK